MARTRSIQRFDDDSIRRELRAYAIYRAFAAAMIAAVTTGIGGKWLGDFGDPMLATSISCSYLVLAVVMLAILRQRADADTAAPQSPAPARPCLCGHGALDHDDNGDCAGVYTYGRRVVLCTCTHYMRQGVAS